MSRAERRARAFHIGTRDVGDLHGDRRDERVTLHGSNARDIARGVAPRAGRRRFHHHRPSGRAARRRTTAAPGRRRSRHPSRQSAHVAGARAANGHDAVRRHSLARTTPRLCTKWRRDRGRHRRGIRRSDVRVCLRHRPQRDGRVGPLYLGGAAVCTAIGALVGWRIDAAKSKPHITFEPSAGGRTIVSVHPVYSRGGGIAVAVSFSR